MYRDDNLMNRLRIHRVRDKKDDIADKTIKIKCIFSEMISRIMDLLKTIDKYPKEEREKKVRRLLVEIGDHKRIVSLIENEQMFSFGYPEFFHRLLKINSSLTDYEREICMYIKLNMNTKEISLATSRSVNSINVCKVRIRKKLGLNNNKEIYDLISTL